MTLDEKIREMLHERLIMDLDGVMEHIKDNEGFEQSMYPNRWDSNVDEILEPVMVTLWMLICDLVVEWIDANVPRAFYRELFVQ